jgi:response regulator of citrate/malate metabolism
MLEIVLVDDVREDLGLFERVLRHCKIINPVRRMQSGEECISFFKKSSGRYLVFLDLIMAPISGISTLRQIRNAGLAGDSVFVMLSGITDMKAINEGYQAGAHTFLIKPVKADDVMETLNGLKSKIQITLEEQEGYKLEWRAINKSGTDPRPPRFSGSVSPEPERN